MYLNNLHTCAGKEIHGFNEASFSCKKVIMTVSESASYSLYLRRPMPSSFAHAFYVMSYAYNYRNKKLLGARSVLQANRINKLAAYIKRHKLGECFIGPDNGNPSHSGNTKLRSMLWVPDQEALWEHAKRFYKPAKKAKKKKKIPQAANAPEWGDDEAVEEPPQHIQAPQLGGQYGGELAQVAAAVNQQQVEMAAAHLGQGMAQQVEPAAIIHVDDMAEDLWDRAL